MIVMPDQKLYGHKPVIDYDPRLTGKKVWRCRLYHAKLGRIIVGRGTSPEFAYNAYLRNLKWHRKGQPGLKTWQRTGPVGPIGML